MRTEEIQQNDQKAEANLHEIELIQRLAETQDSKALEELYKIYHPRLAGFLRRMTQDEDKISELINEVMYSVWKYSGQFKGLSKVSTWIFTIAYREFCRVLKKDKKQTDLLNKVAETQLIEDQDDSTQESALFESNDLILTALEYLPPEQRMTIELRYFNGNSVSEIAAIAGCPENTVKTRMFHARRKLRTVIEDLTKSELV